MFLIKSVRLHSNFETRVLILWLLIICFSLSYSLAFQCYVCDSKNDVECTEDLPPDSKLVPHDCHKINEPKYCIKTTNIYAGEFGTKRFCASNDYGNRCNYVKQPSGDREYWSCVYTCDTPNCNRSSSLIPMDSPYSICALILVVLVSLQHSYSIFRR